MPLLTPEQCREQCRVIGDLDDAILAELLASAEDAAAAYLNRAVFAAQTDFDTALAAVPTAAAAAQAAYDASVTVAEAEDDEVKAAAMLAVAEVKLASALQSQTRTLYGIVANASITAAVRMLLGHLYENRESTTVGVSVAETPLGFRELLRPYRRVMSP